MTGRQWVWLAVLAAALVYLLAAAKYAYSAGVFGAQLAGFGGAIAWAVTVLGAVAALLELLTAIRSATKRALVGVLNRLAGRIALLAISIVAGTALLVLARQVKPAPTWTCTVRHAKVLTVDGSRCLVAGAVQMRWLDLELRRASPPPSAPSVHAVATGYPRSSVTIDSNLGGECSALVETPPHPAFADFALRPACERAGAYAINVNVCDVDKLAALAPSAAVALTVQEGSDATSIDCR